VPVGGRRRSARWRLGVDASRIRPALGVSSQVLTWRAYGPSKREILKSPVVDGRDPDRTRRCGFVTGPIGSAVKVERGGTDPSVHTPVAAGLFAPYGIAIKGNSAYVTTGAVAAGAGQVIKIRLWREAVLDMSDPEGVSDEKRHHDAPPLLGRPEATLPRSPATATTAASNPAAQFIELRT